MDQAFHESWFNASHTVLGRKLHPFCFEDALILGLVESPFLASTKGNVRYGLEDLQLAVVICSTDSREFLDASFRSSPIRAAWWSWRCRRMDLQAECQKFVTFIDDYFAPPQVWTEDSDGSGLGAPWVVSHVTFLMRHLHISERAAWTMPIGKALWYCACVAEQLPGGSQVASAEEQEAMEALDI